MQNLCYGLPAHPLRRRLRSIWPISDLSADEVVVQTRNTSSVGDDGRHPSFAQEATRPTADRASDSTRSRRLTQHRESEGLRMVSGREVALRRARSGVWTVTDQRRLRGMPAHGVTAEPRASTRYSAGHQATRSLQCDPRGAGLETSAGRCAAPRTENGKRDRSGERKAGENGKRDRSDIDKTGGFRVEENGKRDRSDIDKTGGFRVEFSACREPRRSPLVEWCFTS